MTKVQAHVSDEKKQIIKDLVALIDSKETLMITSIKGLPARQFQKIKKSLEKDVELRVVKKRALKKAIGESKKENIKELEKFVKEDIALLISDMDAFELSAKLGESRSPVKAKAGQEATEDLEIEAGTTDLPAGPAVSELGSLGLTIKVTGGKIEIMENRVIVKKGGIISETAAGVMGKLDIMPFSVGFVPLVAYDSKLKKIFEELKIDKEATVELMKEMFGKTRSLSVNIGYICKDTLGLMLGKAGSHERALASLVKAPEGVPSSKDNSAELQEGKEEPAEEPEAPADTPTDTGEGKEKVEENKEEVKEETVEEEKKEGMEKPEEEKKEEAEEKVEVKEESKEKKENE